LSLIPTGLIVDSVTQDGYAIIVTAHARAQMAMCPLYCSPSQRVHSRYIRQVSDLPCSGRGVCLRFVARRFCCRAPHCRRQIFAERFGETVFRPKIRSRLTTTGILRGWPRPAPLSLDDDDKIIGIATIGDSRLPLAVLADRNGTAPSGCRISMPIFEPQAVVGCGRQRFRDAPIADSSRFGIDHLEIETEI